MPSRLPFAAISAIAVALAACGGSTADEPVDAGRALSAGGAAGQGTGGATGQGTGGAAGQGGATVVDAGRDASACGVIRASDYDQSCTTNADCTSVFEGDTCTAICACPNASINTKALDSYHPEFGGRMVFCPCAMIAVPTCLAGVCTMCPLGGCPSKDVGVKD